MTASPEVNPGESIPVVTQRESSKMEVVVEAIVVQKEDAKLPKSAVQELKQSFRERKDDWFLLLDVVPREKAYVPPGIPWQQMSLS